MSIDRVLFIVVATGPAIVRFRPPTDKKKWTSLLRARDRLIRL